MSGINDHSRYVVSAQVVARATARPTCDALLLAVERHGAPEHIPTGGYHPTVWLLVLQRSVRGNALVYTPAGGPVGPAMKVFLSYRRRDVGGYAGRLTDALVHRLGGRNVFHDVTAITPGRNFAEQINRALNDSDAVLAVIGPGWATVSSSGEASRLFDADDYVRLELSTALARGIRSFRCWSEVRRCLRRQIFRPRWQSSSNGKRWCFMTRHGTGMSMSWCAHCVASRRRRGNRVAGWLSAR